MADPGPATIVVRTSEGRTRGDGSCGDCSDAVAQAPPATVLQYPRDVSELPLYNFRMGFYNTVFNWVNLWRTKSLERAVVTGREQVHELQQRVMDQWKQNTQHPRFNSESHWYAHGWQNAGGEHVLDTPGAQSSSATSWSSSSA